MPDLPPGWRLSNSSGTFASPHRSEVVAANEQHENGFVVDDNDEDIDIRPDSPGWEDVGDDVEDSVIVKCLFCQETFTNAKPMLDHCISVHQFDLLDVQRRNQLDFYSTIKLVNYVRATAALNAGPPDVNDVKLWQPDDYLQPTIPDDGLLLSLDDVVDFGTEADVPDYDKIQEAAAAKAQNAELNGIQE